MTRRRMSTRTERIENLATAFIERTTEWDFDQLPATVPAWLRHAATTFVDWLGPETVTETRAVGHLATPPGSLSRETEAIARLRSGQDCGYYCVCGFAVGITADGSIVHAGTGEPCEVA